MRSPLKIAAPSLSFVRVRFGDEFRKRSVHLDIVRYEQSAITQAGPELAKFPEHVAIAMRTVVQEQVDRLRQLVAFEKIFDSAAHRHESMRRSQFFGN